MSAASEPTLDAILAELDQTYDELPDEAIRAAQRRREEITPRLIDLIRQATETVRAGDTPKGDGYIFAFYLLTEFKAREALPTILEALSLPEDGPFNLLGDGVEDIGRMLAALVETPEAIDALITNRSLNECLRWEAAQTYLDWVRDGRMTRDEVVQRLRGHLADAIAKGDGESATILVCELIPYAPREAVDKINEAFARGLVDDIVVGPRSVQRSIAEGETYFHQALEHCRPTGVADTVAELSRWHCFQERPETPTDSHGKADSPPILADRSRDFDRDDEGPLEAPPTIRNPGPKVGRNDPCPCGSGKKYKRCCGRR